MSAGEAPPGGGLGGARPPAGPVGYYTPPAAEGASRPAAILWYRVFAITSALIYGGLAFLWGSFAAQPEPNPSPHIVLSGLVYVLPVIAFYGVAAAVPYKPWGWTFALVAIAFGTMSCLAPFSVILVIMWSRPQVKAAFGRV